MVSVSVFIGLFFTVTCSMILPCIFWIVLSRKYKGVGRWVSVGLLGYCVPQLLIIMPISMFLSTSEAFAALIENQIFCKVFGAVISAVFETCGRFVVVKYVMKQDGRLVSVCGAGLGHGICESVISGGIMYMVNLSVCFMINAGTLPESENYENIKNDLINIPVSDCFAAGVERLSILVFQVALYVILAYFILKKQKNLGLAVCTAVQTVFISLLSVIALSGISVWITEGVAAVAAVVVALFAWSKREIFPKESAKQNL